MWSQLELHTWVLNNSLMLSQVSVVTGGNFRNLYTVQINCTLLRDYYSPKIQHSLLLKSYLSKLKVVFQASCFWELLNSWGCPNGAPGNAETVRVNGATKASACGWKHHVMASILQQGSERRKVRRISRNLNEFIARIFYPYFEKNNMNNGSFTSFPSNWITWELPGFVVRMHWNFSELL